MRFLATNNPRELLNRDSVDDELVKAVAQLIRKSRLRSMRISNYSGAIALGSPFVIISYSTVILHGLFDLSLLESIGFSIPPALISPFVPMLLDRTLEAKVLRSIELGNPELYSAAHGYQKSHWQDLISPRELKAARREAERKRKYEAKRAATIGKSTRKDSSTKELKALDRQRKMELKAQRKIQKFKNSLTATSDPEVGNEKL